MYCLAKKHLEDTPPGQRVQARTLSYGPRCDVILITLHPVAGVRAPLAPIWIPAPCTSWVSRICLGPLLPYFLNKKPSLFNPRPNKSVLGWPLRSHGYSSREYDKAK